MKASFSAADNCSSALASERINRLLNDPNDRLEMLAAGGLGRGFCRAGQLDGRGHGAAPRVPHDENQLRPGHGAGILHAAQDLATDDVPGDADAEDVAQAQVEDQFGGRAGVDATEHHGQRMLPGGRGVDLAAEVAGQPLPGAEPLVAVFRICSTCCGVSWLCSSRVE